MNYVVVDLEMNPVSRDYREVRRTLRDEVIEFGAVRLDASFAQESTFQCYVRPQYGPIRKQITALTGITQEKVDGGEIFEKQFQAFVDWVGDAKGKAEDQNFATLGGRVGWKFDERWQLDTAVSATFRKNDKPDWNIGGQLKAAF